MSDITLFAYRLCVDEEFGVCGWENNAPSLPLLACPWLHPALYAARVTSIGSRCFPVLFLAQYDWERVDVGEEGAGTQDEAPITAMARQVTSGEFAITML